MKNNVLVMASAALLVSPAAGLHAAVIVTSTRSQTTTVIHDETFALREVDTARLEAQSAFGPASAAATFEWGEDESGQFELYSTIDAVNPAGYRVFSSALWEVGLRITDTPAEIGFSGVTASGVHEGALGYVGASVNLPGPVSTHNFYGFAPAETETSVGRSVVTLDPGDYVLRGFFWPQEAYPLASYSYESTVTFDLGDFTIAAGATQNAPILPQPGGGVGESAAFVGASTGGWFDPPMTEAFEFDMTDGAKFTAILGFPIGIDGDGLFQVIADGVDLGWFEEGDMVTFAGGGVSQFTVLGIDPAVDVEDPMAFPIQLEFNQPTASFTMTPVPEPASLALLAASVLLIFRRR